MDSSRFCNVTYSEDEHMVEQCERTMMTKGLSNAMYTLYAFIQQSNINFDADAGRRSPSYLRDMLDEGKMSDMTDVVLVHVKAGFMVLANKLIESVEKYFQAQEDKYLIIFGIFISVTAVMSLVLGVLLFRKVKRRILEVQNMLALLPLGEMEPN